ncbi:hypothetical protein CFO_g3155 [Ceratocystis platani]|uniref:Uncharacterized protein n=1 Tax=Ceratocystis fimbriata f. sp. platani TaxID=88771 RepID=A0A0F8B3A0_CERFI|nr:hypothetical protein CFO_g3155 [Ceratocystis platani]
MIRCVQNGDEISLSLGKLPTLNYSSTSYKIPKSETSNPHDLFFTQPFESLRKAHRNILERNKLQRVMVVHELAVRDQATEYLREKWTGKMEEFDAALHKAAEFDSTSKTWSLAKNYWKELDVWNYDYDSEQERQEAINNAISKYDRMRLSPNQDEWQRLLPADERGKGKCLSRIQANLMKGPMSSVKTSEDKSEAMSRSKSNPLPKPTKTERDAPKPNKTSSVKSKETAKELATETKDGDGRKAKRPHAPPEELINKAARFKLNYERYAKLHAQIVNTENPRKDQVDYLTDLREKLKDMKSTIYYEHLLSYNS